MPTTTSPFTKDLFHFLGELALNNEREWFKENQSRYEAHVREPARAFIRAFAPHLRKISKHLVANDAKVGGSLMRIHRDVRFGKDKTPYKTNLGIQFRHEAGKDVHAPGLYVHVEPDSIFLGAGMWQPDGPSLAAIRKTIVEKPSAWKRVTGEARFKRRWEFGGDSLKRAPRGFDPDHPLIEDLKRKSHIATLELTPNAVSRRGFVEKVAEAFQEAKPYMRLLTKSQDLPF